MTQLAQAKRWLTLAEAAGVASRSERTIRNWVSEGILAPRVPGFFDRHDVLAAERTMRSRRGRPQRAKSRVIEIVAGTLIEVTPCGKHAPALNVGLAAVDCVRCRIEELSVARR